MTIASFIIFTGLCGLVFNIMLLIKKHYQNDLLPILGLTLLFPASSWLGNFIFQNPFHENTMLYIRLYFSSLTLIVLCIAEFVTVFMRETPMRFSIGKNSIQAITPARILAASGVLLCFFLEWIHPAWIDGSYIFLLHPTNFYIRGILFLLSVFILFCLENTYRFASISQRRAGRIFFISLFVMLMGLVLFLIRMLLFNTFTEIYVQTATVLFGLCFPAFLFGLLRYRLWSDKITIARDTVYSSVTLLIVGAVLLGLSIAVYFSQKIGFSFNYFELFLVIFTVVFFSLLIVSSAPMRKRIMRAVNSRLYKRKYDYQEQFFRLHQTYMAGTNMVQTITNLINNLKYTLTVEDIYLFIRNGSDGNLYIHPNPQSELSQDIRKNIWISGDSPLFTVFKNEELPLDFIHASHTPREQSVMTTEQSLIQRLGISAVFPVNSNNQLYGLLLIKSSPKFLLDYEDKRLIRIFSASIGSLFFKTRVLQKSIENKQFDSFSQISSFIIHDIKNQVSTLSLLDDNAKKNISDPAFQKSLLHSLANCISNLQKLVDKFSSLPKNQAMEMRMENCNDIVKNAIDHCGLAVVRNLSLETELKATEKIMVDSTLLYFAVINLITNALDAMERKGVLRIITGDVTAFPKDSRNTFHISDTFVSAKKVYIMISDTGKGMSKEFLEQKLFHPFISTKDKGIGIGLYQSKLLIEKMNGNIVCSSVEKQGTTFCIFL